MHATRALAHEIFSSRRRHDGNLTTRTLTHYSDHAYFLSWFMLRRAGKNKTHADASALTSVALFFQNNSSIASSRPRDGRFLFDELFGFDIISDIESDEETLKNCTCGKIIYWIVCHFICMYSQIILSSWSSVCNTEKLQINCMRHKLNIWGTRAVNKLFFYIIFFLLD